MRLKAGQKATPCVGRRLSPILLLVGVGFASPAKADPTCAAPAQTLSRVELFFGAAGGVTPRAFANFLAREVTPRFPDGLSLFEGRGQWRDGTGRVSREPARLVLIYYRPDRDTDGKIEAIRAAYKRRFHQQSVLRAESSACVAF
ncbi:MAG: DUF3574 domain-containing protein [Roseiarcus sp.]